MEYCKFWRSPLDLEALTTEGKLFIPLYLDCEILRSLENMGEIQIYQNKIISISVTPILIFLICIACV